MSDMHPPHHPVESSANSCTDLWDDGSSCLGRNTAGYDEGDVGTDFDANYDSDSSGYEGLNWPEPKPITGEDYGLSDVGDQDDGFPDPPAED